MARAFSPQIINTLCSWGCTPGWDGLGLWPILGAVMLRYCRVAERRAALISAAVTGKIDVRGLAA